MSTEITYIFQLWQNVSTTEFNNKHRSNEESRQSRYATEKTFINMIHCSSNAKISTKKSQQIYLRLLPQDQWSSIHSCPTTIANTLEKLTSMKKLKYTNMNHNRYPQHETTFENVSSSAIQFISSSAIEIIRFILHPFKKILRLSFFEIAIDMYL